LSAYPKRLAEPVQRARIPRRVLERLLVGFDRLGELAARVQLETALEPCARELAHRLLDPGVRLRGLRIHVLRLEEDRQCLDVVVLEGGAPPLLEEVGEGGLSVQLLVGRVARMLLAQARGFADGLVEAPVVDVLPHFLDLVPDRGGAARDEEDRGESAREAREVHFSGPSEGGIPVVRSGFHRDPGEETADERGGASFPARGVDRRSYGSPLSSASNRT
jgi:hypothetical protein